MDENYISLLNAAAEVLPNTYSPYSHFPVAAALETITGEIFKGVNIENASFSATICAERSALAQAVTAGHRKFSRIAIVTQTDQPVSPCGICRQMLAEFGMDLVILSSSEKQLQKGKFKKWTLGELLPDVFSEEDLIQ